MSGLRLYIRSDQIILHVTKGLLQQTDSSKLLQQLEGSFHFLGI